MVSYVQPMAAGVQMPAAAPPAAPAAPAPAAQKPAAEAKEAKPEASPAAPAEAVEGTPLTAPMPGMIVRYEIAGIDREIRVAIHIKRELAELGIFR